MKKLIILCLALCAAGALRAQDMIVLRNATADEIPSKVLEVGEEQIRYRKASNPDGPVYSIRRSEVFFIRYENGEKEVITSYESEPEDASGVSYNGSGTSAESSAGAWTDTGSDNLQPAKRKPYRKRSWELGPTVYGGFAAVFFEDDSWVGPTLGVAASGNYYFSRYSRTCVGVNLGVSYSLLTTSSTDDVSLTTLDLDLYYGLAGSKSGSAFGSKLGFSFNVPLGCSMGDIDLGDATNGVSFGMFAQAGWSWVHNDFGFRLQYNFTNTFKDIDSSQFRFGVYYSYRF